MLNTISKDVIGEILEYLDLRSLARLSLVSKDFYSYIEEQKVKYTLLYL